MSDRKKISKKKLMKEAVKLIAPLIPILGILMIIAYLSYRWLLYNNMFTAFLDLWFIVLELDLDVSYILYLEKHSPQGPITETRSSIVKAVQVAKIAVYLTTATGIFAGSFLLIAYFVFQRAATSGLAKALAPISSQEAIVTSLLLVSLPLLAYVTKREAEKVIQIEMENATDV
mgnify:FL=1